MLEHRVEDNQQLAHAGCEGQLLRLTSGQQPLVEVPYDGVEAAAHQRSHVQGGADPCASTPDGAFATQRTAVPVEGSYAYQSGDLPTVQRAQLRQVGQEGERELLSHTGGGAQEVVLLSPNGTMTESLPQALVQVGQLPLQPGYVGLDAGADGDGGDAKTVLLRDQHRHHLVPAGSQGVERLGLGVPQRARGRSDDFGEVGQNRRVKRVGLGQLPGGPGKVPHLAGVNDDHWQLLGRQSCYKGQFQAARSLQQHHNRFKGLQPGDQLPDPCIVIGNLPDGDIHLGLGYINAYVDPFLIHELLRITARPCKMRAWLALATVRALIRKGCGDPRFLTVLHDGDGLRP